MRRFKDNPSEQYLRVVSAIQELAESEGLDSAMRAYGEAVTEREKQMFADKHKVKKRQQSHVCTTRLMTKGRCPASWGKDCSEPRFPARDHVMEWMRDGKTEVITSEPYGITFENLKELVTYCERHSLRADIGAGSWHFPHSTLLVELRRKGVAE